MTPDLRAFLARFSERGFTPARPSEVRALDALVRAGLAVKAGAGVWKLTTEGEKAREAQEVVK